jgi:hypothetical protein
MEKFRPVQSTELRYWVHHSDHGLGQIAHAKHRFDWKVEDVQRYGILFSNFSHDLAFQLISRQNF